MLNFYQKGVHIELNVRLFYGLVNAAKLSPLVEDRNHSSNPHFGTDSSILQIHL